MPLGLIRPGVIWGGHGPPPVAHHPPAPEGGPGTSSAPSSYAGSRTLPMVYDCGIGLMCEKRRVRIRATIALHPSEAEADPPCGGSQNETTVSEVCELVRGGDS